MPETVAAEPCPKPLCVDRPVWVEPDAPRGFVWETWSPGSGGTTGTQVAFDSVWSGPADADGVPTHVAGAPTASGVETDTRFSQIENAQDEHRLTFWVWNNSPDTWQLSDTDTRAESLRIYAGCDCPSTLVFERYETPEGGPYTSDGPFMNLAPGGLVKLTVLMHDAALYSGFRLRANTLTNQTTFDPVSYQERPRVGVIVVSSCDALETGQSLTPIAMDCHDCVGAGGEVDEATVQALIDASLPAPSDAVPVPDNDVDTSIRVGAPGVSPLFARADHNHPIRLQANPGDPVITAGGSFAIVNSIIMDRWPEEDAYAWAFSVRVTQPAGVSWGFLSVPTIPGFRQPQFLDIGTYRWPATAPQTDDAAGAGGVGAAPRGAFMSKEVNHWRSTRRLYGAYLRRDNQIDMYVDFVVRFIRA